MYREKITALMEKMTFEEKVGQMSQMGTSIYTEHQELDERVAGLIREGKVGSFLSITGVDTLNEMQRIAVEESRLGIPLFFAHDIIHGYRTIFPVPAGEACSFEPQLAYENYKVLAKETRANGIHVTWTPMVDITHDQRWGRGYEGAGEDVLLDCEFTKARVRGIQNDDLKSDNAVAACAKHYVGYGAVIGGRDYNSVDMSDNELYNTYLPPFRTAVDEDVEFVMTAFHDLNGIPCTSNKKLMKDILRNELGFKGVIVSDWGSLTQTLEHGFAEDAKEAAQKGIDAGLDIEMGANIYWNGLENTHENEKLIDEAVYRILDLKFRLGLFEKPYTEPEKAEKAVAKPEYMELARNTAKKSMVLLENNGILPLKQKKLAIIGALANDRSVMIGGWTPAENEKAQELAVTIPEGLRNSRLVNEVLYAPAYTYISTTDEQLEQLEKGIYDYFSTTDELIHDAIKTSEEADVILFVAGEVNVMNGEAMSRASLEIPEAQKRVLNELSKLNKPIVMLAIAGRPLLLKEFADKTDAIIFTYSLGTQMGNAVADVITGTYNPSAKLAYTIPAVDGQSPSMYYSHNNTGKPYSSKAWWTSKYIDAPSEPAYCFGYGRSYTEFEYKKITTDKGKYRFGEKVILTVTVGNVGNYDGEEVVQIYFRDLVGSITRPVKQLVAFKKVMLKKGQIIDIDFEIDTNKLGFYMDREYILESGKFKFFAGGDSNATLETDIQIL